MRSRSVDRNNDWNFGRGRNDYKRDGEALIQNLRTRLQSFLGDCFFEQTAGIDWTGLSGVQDQRRIALDVAAVILNTEGVTRLIDFSASLRTDRTFVVSYTVQTVYGTMRDESIEPLGVI